MSLNGQRLFPAADRYARPGSGNLPAFTSPRPEIVPNEGSKPAEETECSFPLRTGKQPANGQNLIAALKKAPTGESTAEAVPLSSSPSKPNHAELRGMKSDEYQATLCREDRSDRLKSLSPSQSLPHLSEDLAIRAVWPQVWAKPKGDGCAPFIGRATSPEVIEKSVATWTGARLR